MKMLGFVMVILSCSVFGLNMARGLSRRGEFLQGLCTALTVLRNELCISLMPVADVLRQLAADERNSASEFFKQCFAELDSEGFKTAWSAAALGGKTWGLEVDECRILAELGGVIGRYEAEKQRELIDRVITYFENRARLADEEKRRQFKLRAALGVGSGLMIAILML